MTTRTSNLAILLALANATLLAACEGDTTGLGDGNVFDDDAPTGRDAGPRDIEPDPDLGPPDSGALPEEWTVVPCPPSAEPLQTPLRAGNGALEGVLTVFVLRYPLDSALAGSRVLLEKGARSIEGTTDERGCVRFVGRDLVGPVQVTASALDFTLSLTRGLSSAQLDTSVESRASLSQPIMLPTPPEGIVAGTVTGFERFPSVTSTGSESRHVRAEVMPIYRRVSIPFGRPEAGRRAAPFETLWSNIAYLGKLERGPSEPVDLRDFELPVWSDDFLGLEVSAEHEIDWGNGDYTRVRPFVGVTLDLTVGADERLESQTIDMNIPRTRSLTVEPPELPAWATSGSAGTSIYIPEIDAFAFGRSVVRDAEPLLRPEFSGPLSSGEEVVNYFAAGEAAGSNAQRPSLAVYARTRAATAVIPPPPARPEVTLSGRRLSVSYSGSRDGGRIHLSLRSATGGFLLIDLSDEASFEVEIPPASETLAVPDLSANMLVFSDWFHDSESSDIRIANDGVELRARYSEGREVDLTAN